MGTSKSNAANARLIAITDQRLADVLQNRLHALVGDLLAQVLDSRGLPTPPTLVTAVRAGCGRILDEAMCPTGWPIER